MKPVPTTINASDLLNADQIAELLGVSRNTIYDLVRQNKIPHRHIGKQPRFPVWLIINWFNEWEGGSLQ